MTIPSLGPNILDTSWQKSSFLLSANQLSDSPFQEYATFTTAMLKVGDTALGGSVAINAPPQNCPLADIRVPNASSEQRKHNGEESFGLGRAYSENIQDNFTLVSFQFGTMRYKGMLGFFLNFYDSDQAALARTGRGTSIFFKAGQVIGTAGLIAAMVVSLPFTAVVLGGLFGSFFFGRPGSAYYYISPTMAPYWNRGTWIANALAANMNIVPRNMIIRNTKLDDWLDIQDPVTMDYVSYAHQVAPDLFRAEGGMDLYKTSNRYARLDFYRKDAINKLNVTNTADTKSQLQALLQKTYKDDQAEDLSNYLNRYFSSPLGDLGHKQNDQIDTALANGQDLTSLGGSPAGGDVTTSDQQTADQANAAADQPASTSDRGAEDYRNQWRKVSDDPSNPDGQKLTDGFLQNLFNDIGIDARQGNQWVTFCCNHFGTSTESFSNNLREPDISQTLNSISGQAASARFSFSGGDTNIPGISEVMGAVTDLFKGTLSLVHMDGLLALAGNANIGIPKQYDSSSASFQDQTITMELRTPYGNPLAIYINLLVPLSLILAAALPMSTGTQSYTAPYFCNAFSRGRFHFRNAMITQLTITRAVGNLGMNQSKMALGYDVQMVVTSAEQIMHAPVDVGLNFLKPWKLAIDDDSAFKDYLSTLASLSLADQEMMQRKIAIQFATQSLNIQSAFSASSFANTIGDAFGVQMLGKLQGAFGGYENTRLLKGN